MVKEAIALEKLKEARAAQILDKRKCQAVEVMKRKEEIQKMIQVCQEEQEEEKLTQMQKLKVGSVHLNKYQFFFHFIC